MKPNDLTEEHNLYVNEEKLKMLGSKRDEVGNRK
jgi:hypothetical protein